MGVDWDGLKAVPYRTSGDGYQASGGGTPFSLGGPVEIFLNDRSTVTKESPQMAGLSFGGGNTMFIEVTSVDALHDAIKPRIKVTMPLVTQWYGWREFAIVDPDGYVITFAQRIKDGTA